MKLASSALYAVAILVAAVSATPAAAPAGLPAVVAGEQGSADLSKREEQPREDDPECWKCPSSARFTLVGQERRNDKEWTCKFKYDPPIWQFWKLPDRLDSGPKYCYYDTYYGEWTGRQSCSGYTCDYGCVYHMVDTCRTWN